MGKFAADSIMDAALDEVINNGKLMTVTSGQPTTYGSAVAQGADMLAQVAIAAADWTKADGDSSGRKATVSTKSAVPVSATGTGDHINVVSSAGASTLLYTTTVSGAQTLTAGNTVTFNGWRIEIGDPT